MVIVRRDDVSVRVHSRFARRTRRVNGHRAEYFGRAVARSTLCGLRAIETVYRPGETLPWHSHDSAYLVVTLGGAMTEIAARGRNHACVRGWLVLDTAGEAHCDQVGPDGAR